MTIDYAAIKAVHVTAAATSLALFLLRAAWMLWSPARLATGWVRVVPHIVDTILLASALWLAWQLGADGTRGWLVAKVVAVLVYIAAGAVALKRGRTRGVRIGALVVALATFAYIVSVALTKSVPGFFVWL